ncbi:MAG: RnfABCDGE type electron transport complex subunit C [Phycisphaerae bacterium]|nr:RnfABCDGE type electron transport complex subunit C [Phycisphaerae bacterium]
MLTQSRRSGTFFGGVFLPEEKASTGDRDIQPLPVTGPLRVPMLQHEGSEATFRVAAGQRVLAGQLIGHPEAGAKSVAVHSPASGHVTGIVRADTPWACDVLAVGIEPDDRDEWVPLSGTPVESLDVEALIECVRQAGIVRMGNGAAPAGDLLASAARRGVRHLIINALESEPYLTAEYRILFEHGHRIVSTANLVGRLLGVQRLWLALDRGNRYLAEQLRRIAHGTPVRVLPLPNKYPQGAEPLLVNTVVGREIPYAGAALDVGALVLDVATIQAIGHAIHEGRPLTARVVTVAGDAASKPGNYLVPVGTPLHRIVEHVGLKDTIRRAVIGGPMTGTAVSGLDVVTTKQVGALLLLTDEQVGHRAPGPCIRCGWCLEDCPVGLDPPSVLAAVEAHYAEIRQRPGPTKPSGYIEEMAGLYPHACLGCGICTYVCPACLPLAEGLARARTLVSVSHE